MRVARVPHRWNISPARAIAIQKTLALRIIVRRTESRLDLVAGADAAFSEDGSRCIAGIVVWDARTRSIIERQAVVRRVTFPYVPGLLSFREAPALLSAIRRLRCWPDAFLFDGQGYAHPRRFGLACHLGMLIGRPSAGCAKSVLVGECVEPGLRRGACTELVDRGECIGAALRTRDGVKPVYVSVGHRVDLKQAVDLVLRSGNGYRLPEPTRLADQLVAAVKRGEKV